MTDYLSLLDYRRRNFALYSRVRELLEEDPVTAHARWRAGRDELFGAHPQSPLSASTRRGFPGLRYYDYNPAFAFEATVDTDIEAERFEVPMSGGETMSFHRFGVVDLPGLPGALEVFWLDAYGGGIFLPFRDATGGDTTYGGGRYLLDTVKGADLSRGVGPTLTLDFNFSYHPSCHYDPAWSCPLAPPGNWLDARVEAGEQSYH